MRLHAKQVLCAMIRELLCFDVQSSDLHDKMGTTVTYASNRTPAGVWFNMPIAFHFWSITFLLLLLVTTPSIVCTARLFDI